MENGSTMNEFDSVVLTVNLPEHNLKRGDVGTIVHFHEDEAAYIVEFMTFGGDSIAVVTLSRNQVRPALATELPHVRAIAS